MSKRYYAKAVTTPPRNTKRLVRICGIVLFLLGIGISVYVFMPVILWNIFLAPVFASQSIVVPIPKSTLVTSATIQSLLTSQGAALSGVDYTNATNWFPHYTKVAGTPRVPSYQLSIPKIGIDHATVSTVDDDLSKHLVNFNGTCTPPDKGNCVIFGHSTLPQLFNPKDYKTIFANAHTLQVGDTIIVDSENIRYTYKIFSITVVDPDDTSVLEQTLDDSYLTLITCTPPGTLWKRLVIRSRLERL